MMACGLAAASERRILGAGFGAGVDGLGRDPSILAHALHREPGPGVKPAEPQ